MGQETVEVPAESFAAWRIEVVEDYPGADGSPTGALWVAAGVGVVRSRPERGGEVQTMEFARHGGAGPAGDEVVP